MTVWGSVGYSHDASPKVRPKTMLPVNRHRIAVAAVAFALVVPAVGQEAEPDLRDEIESLKQGQQQIRKDLQEIKGLLQAQRRPAAPSGPNVKDKVFDLGANPVLGERTAKITLVEFTDYQ